MNRRRDPRRVAHERVRISTVSEAALPSARLVDVSAGGVLAAFEIPPALTVAQRVCLSVDLDDGALHLLASVVRLERGDDLRTYVGLALDDRPTSWQGDPERERWCRWLDERRPQREPVASSSAS